MILPAEKVTMPGEYWARVPGRTDWFIMDIKRPEQIREQDQMVGFEFKPILPPQ